MRQRITVVPTDYEISDEERLIQEALAQDEQPQEQSSSVSDKVEGALSDLRDRMGSSGKARDDMAGLLDTPKATDNDIDITDLVELDMEDVYGGPEDMSDITGVDWERDVMGMPLPSKRASKQRKIKYRLTGKRYEPPLTSMRGMR